MSAAVKGLQNHQPVIDVLCSKWTMCNPKRAFDHLMHTSASASVVEVQIAQPRSRLPMILDGWFRRYASLNLERFDFSRLAVVPNLLLVCYTNL